MHIALGITLVNTHKPPTWARVRIGLGQLEVEVQSEQPSMGISLHESMTSFMAS